MRRVPPRTRTGSLPKGQRTKSEGFTLIEIMVVVVILGIMAALVVPNIAGRQEQAQRTAVESDLNALANALEFYRLDNFTYPSTEQGHTHCRSVLDRSSRVITFKFCQHNTIWILQHSLQAHERRFTDG